MSSAFMQSNLTIEAKKRTGKVRDMYDLGEHQLMVTTDRISAFDWVLPTGIPDKGRVLTSMTLFWISQLKLHYPLVAVHPVDIEILQPAVQFGDQISDYVGRTLLVKTGRVLPVECIVRGYLAGSGWIEYQRRGTVCDILLPAGLKESVRLPQPIFTPSTKATAGHDENISFAKMIEALDGNHELAKQLRNRSLDIYSRAHQYALSKGIIIADTKFEFAIVADNNDEELLIIDEVLTPDSSRFWPANQYEIGRGQPSFDKQFIRDWLTKSGWDKNSEPPALPDDIVTKTRHKYIEACERLTGSGFVWK